MSVFRLLPKVRVPTTTTMARVEARMDERTGTDVRPRPPSRANRSPSSAGAGTSTREAAWVIWGARRGRLARRAARRPGAPR